MIAAVLPGAWTAALLATHEGDVWTCARVTSFEVGRGKGDAREMTEADLNAAALRILGLVRGVERVYVDTPRPKAVAAATRRDFVEILTASLTAANIPWESVAKWRDSGGYTQRLQGEAAAKVFAAWPTKSYQCERAAAAMMLEAAGEGVPRFKRDDDEVSGEERDAPSPSRRAKRPLGDCPAIVDGGASQAVAWRPNVVAPPPPVPPPPVAIRAGIDPGAGKLAVVIASGLALPLALVAARTFAVGERVPLKTPRKSTTAAGRERVTTTRHSLTGEHVDALATEILALLQSHGVARAIIEHADHAFLTDSSAKDRSLATAMMRTQWVDGAIGERLRANGIEVIRVAAVTWRARVSPRKGRRGSGAAFIPEAVTNGFVDWPASNEHERDAAGLCLYDAMGAPVAKRVRKRYPSSPRARQRQREKVAAKRAEKAALGCSCTRRHRRECPLWAPRTYKRSERMAAKLAAKASA